MIKLGKLIYVYHFVCKIQLKLKPITYPTFLFLADNNGLLLTIPIIPSFVVNPNIASLLTEVTIPSLSFVLIIGGLLGGFNEFLL